MRKLLIGLTLLASMSSFANTTYNPNECEPTAEQDASTTDSFTRLQDFFTTEQRMNKFESDTVQLGKDSKDCDEYSAALTKYVSDLADGYDALKGYGI